MRCKENILTKTPVVILLAFICLVLWGSAFSGVEIGYEKFGIDSADWSSQMIFAGVRFAISGIMALVFDSISARKTLLPTRQSVPKIMIISMFQAEYVLDLAKSIENCFGLKTEEVKFENKIYRCMRLRTCLHKKVV